MSIRLLMLSLLLSQIELALAKNDSAWNCEQNESGQWSCVNGPTPAATTEPALANATKPSANTANPVQSANKPQQAAVAQPSSLPATAKTTTAAETAKTANQHQTPTCAQGNDSGSWHCNLTGAPKAPDENQSYDSSGGGLLGAAFTGREEAMFKTLQTGLKNDPWQNCTRPTEGKPQRSDNGDARNASPMDVNADYSEVFDEEIVSFYGNVDVSRADQHIAADKVSYDTVSETLDAQGRVFYTENEMAVSSESATLRMASDEARLRDLLFIAPAGPVRGGAKVAYRDSKTLSRYEDAAFTSCRPGNQDWVVHASRLKMNKESGQGSAKNAWLEFKGVPVLYTPYISFPMDNRRLSGLLSPTWGSTDKNGFDVSAPFYWNIAPNYDAVITPRYMTRRGGMLRSKFRYLTERSSGIAQAEYLPDDQIRGQARYSGSLEDKTLISKHMFSDVDLNYVSDQDYFNDLNNALGFNCTRHLRSRADLNYNREGVDFLARMESFQAVDRSILIENRPYQKLPQLQLNLSHPFEGLPIEVAMKNDYTHFFRSGRVSGQRFNIEPSVSFPLETSASFLTPKIALKHSEYMLTDQLPGRDDNISRTLPVFSADTGLFFDRDLTLGSSSYVNTLEPRAYYLYIPHSDQRDIPLFDTALYDQNYHSIFRDNRFSGSDRIQDANQVTLGFTSRLIDSAKGLERVNLSIGEILYFRDRDVIMPGQTVRVNGVKTTLPDEATGTNNWSNLITELSGQLSKHISYNTGLQWNPDINDITRGHGSLRYRNQPDELFNVGYRYRRDNPSQPATIIQSDVSFRWPLFSNWYAMGRWQYSLKFNQTTESFIGLEKENCCWRFRLIGRRFLNTISNTIDAKADNALFVQLELKGLTSFGNADVDTFLERNLTGYTKPEY